MANPKPTPDDDPIRTSPAPRPRAGNGAPASDGEVIIRFEDVHKSFGKQHVLDGLTFDVHRGRTLGIMGASGSGKSVLLRHAIGLLKPDSGKVEVEGQEVTRLKRKALSELRRRMGFLFQ